MRIHEVPLEDCVGVLGEVITDVYVPKKGLSQGCTVGQEIEFNQESQFPPRPEEDISAKPDKIVPIINYSI